ncbi:alcohol dehydrogenase catalytic domain-containing protein [Microlunatus spumicola]|uniref:alcohol dehydrogenase catalytic domain-containing protein n=1 Tax=Microlunatus spumicola TaxID=81499 RepID=UPI00195EBBB3
MTPAGSVATSMRVSVLTGQKALGMEERAVPVPEGDQVLVQVSKVGVCGSDVHYYRDGRIGPFVVDAPLVLGHELSGTIVAVGAGVDASRIGQRVAVEPQKPCRRCSQCKAGRYNLCPFMEFYATPPIDGAFCEYVAIEEDFAHPVPDSISDEAAALLEPLSVGIAAARKGRIVPGSRVLIAGGGPIGVITAQAARAFGAAEIIVSDPVADRRKMAERFGATATVDPTQVDTTDLQVDCFIDACGVPAAIVAGMESVRGAGTVVIVGTGSDTVAMPIPTIMNKELNVTGVFRYTDTWPLGAHLVATGQVELDPLVTGRFGLDDVENALNADLQPGSLKSIVAVR